MAPNLPDLQKGDVVAGRFRIVEMIGSGGFSVVYRAHQEAMNRFIALKVLKPTASHDAKIVERFRREALYASHLSHPNTITLFDYGHTDDGLCYIAMEYLVGTDLSAVVQLRDPMDLKRVWKILVQCCRSLAEAHRLGLVHRDLKPENIFLCHREDGEFVKVLDFGVSKAISAFGDAGPSTLAPLTQEGTVFGTPLYMAPEQAMAESISPAVDIYALGHIVFEMITGYAAYESCNNAMDVMLRQINDPPLALPSPWDSTPFSDLVTACTQKEPAHRIQGAAALLDELMKADFEPYMDPTERPARTRTLPRTPAISIHDTEPNLTDHETQQIYRWELEVLEDALAECRQRNEMRLVVIRGQPGTGRSNLLRAFMQRQLADEDLTILHRHSNGDASDTSLENELSVLTGIPLQGEGIAEVKRLLLSIYGDDLDLSQTVDEIETNSRPLNTLTSVRETMLTRIAEPFRNRSETTPIIWGLENLERLDTLTLAFLDRFFRELQAHPAPVMFVATVYPEDLKQRTGLLRYTQGMLQAGKPLARQLSLVPPGEAKDTQEEEIDDLLGKIPEDIAADGSYLGFPGKPDRQDTEDEEHPEYGGKTERMEAVEGFEDVDNVEGVEGAFDRVMGYLAQLGDEVPRDLWKLVYARILDTQLIRVVDSIMSQAEKFGIVQVEDDLIRFTKPGFAEMLRESFEELDDAESSHARLAELMDQFYASPSHDQIKAIASQWRLGGNPSKAVNLLFHAGERAFQNIDLDASREFYLQIQKIFESTTTPIRTEFDKAQLWMRLGEIHGALGEHGAAEDALNRALSGADVNDRKIHGKAYKLLGDLASSQERYNDALKSYEKARDAFRNLGQARPFVAITSEMGRCALQQNRASLAEDLSRQALEMAQKLKDPALIGRIHRHLGQVLTRRARFVEATEHLEKSMELFEGENRDLEVIECLQEVGNASYASGNFADAREHFTRAIALVSSLHLGGQFEPHLGLARTLAAAENLAQAEIHLAEALARSGTAQDLSRMAEIHLYMADLKLASDRHDEAREHLELMGDLAERIGLMRLWQASKIRDAYIAFDLGDEARVFKSLGSALEKAEELGDRESALVARAHIIYVQLLQHGFEAKGDTFSTLLSESADLDLPRASVIAYLFKADVEASRGKWAKAREFLRFSHIGAAQAGDYSLFIPIARRNYLLQKEMGHLGDPHAGAGWSLGAMIPPEVGRRRFSSFPRAQ